MKTIGKKIKELRVKRGWKQSSLYIDNPSLISKIESGEIKTPTRETLEIIADNLEISFDELVKDTDWEKGYNEVKKTQYYKIARQKEK